MYSLRIQHAINNNNNVICRNGEKKRSRYNELCDKRLKIYAEKMTFTD